MRDDELRGLALLVALLVAVLLLGSVALSEFTWPAKLALMATVILLLGIGVGSILRERG